MGGPAGGGAGHGAGGGAGADGANGAILAALPPLLYAAMGSQARYVVSGMETLLFGFLVVAAAYLLVMRDRPLTAGWVFALAAMTRPEGVMYAVLAGGLDLLGDRKSAAAAVRRPQGVPVRRGPVLSAGP